MNSKPLGKVAVIAAVAAILQGCVTTYVPQPDEPMVTVRTVGFGRPQLCKDGKYYFAPPAKGIDNAVSIPAASRVTVGAHLVSDGYQVVHYCRPFLSFEPKLGQMYFMNSALSGDGRCGVELVREDRASKTGLAVEPSVAQPVCSAAK
ncbi:hypothetical protein LJR118_004361 [Acidovorax sp. LjRoot118]|uniref:hypothetical protein n=1 Tax=unclassified Acidovorax TaxID=2684926 RepID=UPI003D04973C